MTDNYRQKTIQAARYQEHRSDWTTKTCDDPWPSHLSPQQASQKALITKTLLWWNLLSISPLQKKRKTKKVGLTLVLPAKGQLYRIKIKNTIPWGERKEEKIRNWSSNHPYLSRHHLLHTGRQAPPVGSKKEQPPPSRCPVDPQQMSHSVTGIRQNPPLSE